MADPLLAQQEAYYRKLARRVEEKYNPPVALDSDFKEDYLMATLWEWMPCPFGSGSP